MNIRKFFLGRAIGFIVVLAVVGGFFLFNHFIYQEKQGDDAPVEPYRATLSGEYVCLPYAEGVSATAEEDCEPGIQTEAGEYYAVNFYLMSQTHAPLEVGQQFSASGVITPIERLSTDHWEAHTVDGIFSVTDSVRVLGEGEEPTVCTADAKLCPDGSYVGRSGPDCAFADCPSGEATATHVTASLGGTATAMGVTIAPQEVVSDSRCPSTVECVWAGTVEVRTILTTPVAHGEHVLTLGKAQVFGEHTVTLVEVSPMKTEDPIADSAYQFTYTVN
jgi:hypothetical protein